MFSFLAYIPFVHPLNLFHDWWYMLLLPLSFGISIIYKAVRLGTLEDFWRKVLVMTAQIVLAMIALAVGVIVVVMMIPHLHQD